MRLTNWLQTISSRSYGAPQGTRKRRRRHYGTLIEHLENRALLSSTVPDPLQSPGMPGTVDTSPPVIDSVTWPSGSEGDNLDLELVVTDDSQGMLEVLVDWGDDEAESATVQGIADPLSSSGSRYDISLPHAWGDDGPWTISISVKDEAGNESTQNGSILLSNLPPEACFDACDDPTPEEGASTGDPQTVPGSTGTTASVPWSVPINEQLDVNGWATDPGWDDDVTLTIDWGDGTQDSVTGKPELSETFRHTYSQAGDFVVALTAQDDEGASGTKQQDLKVLPVVSIYTVDNPASEVGDIGSFRIVREGGTDGDLVVLFRISGSAAIRNGTSPPTDFTFRNASVSQYIAGIGVAGAATIRDGQTEVLVEILPNDDGLFHEGAESLKLTLDTHEIPRYAVGAPNKADIEILDHALVRNIVATAGIRGTDPATGTTRTVIGSTLTLLQGDAVVLEAIPTIGGKFAANEPLWIGGPIAVQAGTTATYPFLTFSNTPWTITAVDASGNPNLPGNPPIPKSVTVALVPAISGISVTFARVPPGNPLGYVDIFGDMYGTDYKVTLVPGPGATAANLGAHAANLPVKSLITHRNGTKVPATHSLSSGTTVNFQLISIAGDIPINPVQGTPRPGVHRVPVKWTYKPSAADSLRNGQVLEIDAEPFELNVKRVLNGFHVDADYHGTRLTENYKAQLAPKLIVAGTIPRTGGTATLIGSVRLDRFTNPGGIYSVRLFDEGLLSNTFLGLITVNIAPTFRTLGVTSGPVGANHRFDTPFVVNVPVTVDAQGQITGVGDNAADLFFIDPAGRKSNVEHVEVQ